MKYTGKVLHFKQGETFSFAGTVLEAESEMPVDSATHTPRSQIRQILKTTTERPLIADLVCEWLAEGAIRIHYPGDTLEWPIGCALWDIQIVDSDNNVRVTENVEVQIHKYVTKNE